MHAYTRRYSHKTEVILFGTQQRLDEVNIAHLQTGQASVLIVTSAVRNLGLWFDVNSKMTEQINNTCQSVYYQLHNIRQIRKFLTLASTKLLVQGVIIARIDYCNGLLMVYLLCIFPNCNVFRIPQHELSPIHPDTVILPQCCLHCIGYQWGSQFAVKSLWSLSRLFTIWGLSI